MQESTLYPDRAGLLVYSLLPCSLVLFRISPLGPQKGCRRQAWHTAGWVGAGSQLGPAGRDLGLSRHLTPHRNSQGPLLKCLWLQELHLGGQALVPTFAPNPSPTLPIPVPYRRRVRPPKAAHWSGVTIAPTWRPFHGLNVTNRNRS